MKNKMHSNLSLFSVAAILSLSVVSLATAADDDKKKKKTCKAQAILTAGMDPDKDKKEDSDPLVKKYKDAYEECMKGDGKGIPNIPGMPKLPM